MTRTEPEWSQVGVKRTEKPSLASNGLDYDGVTRTELVEPQMGWTLMR